MIKLKRIIFGVFLSLFIHEVKAQSEEVYHDSTALLILDQMGSFIGELNSLRFKTSTSTDVAFSQNYMIKEFETAELIFTGPNKFIVKKKGSEKDEIFVYNGSQVSYYSYDDKTYAIADAPPTILETVDWMYESLGIELTIVDFLYPDFTQKLLESLEYIEFMGRVQLNGKEVLHIGGANSEMTVQFWIGQELGFTPVKIVLTYFGEPYAKQIEVDFEGWEVNPTYPDSLFEFFVPPGARQIIWAQKN